MEHVEGGESDTNATSVRAPVDSVHCVKIEIRERALRTSLQPPVVDSEVRCGGRQ